MFRRSVAGKRYRVIRDNSQFFDKGEIVVALETDDAPYCIRESDYVEGMDIEDADISKFHALMISELEEIESE